jgi:hypothetical protein
MEFTIVSFGGTLGPTRWLLTDPLLTTRHGTVYDYRIRSALLQFCELIYDPEDLKPELPKLSIRYSDLKKA